VLDHFTVGTVWTNGMARPEAFYRRVVDGLTRREIPERRAAEDLILAGTARCHLRILNPPAAGAMPAALTASGHVLNNASIVTRLACGRHSILFTADIEQATLARLRESGAFDAEIIKIPHHGAASSFDPLWAGDTHAHAAIVSVGRLNAYGHPSADVLRAYEERGLTTFRTDRDGAIQVRFRPDSPFIEIVRARDLRLAPVPRTSDWWMAELDNLRRLSAF
jgi:beta-lactamase superfamily II metal-dependent hydrolase